MTQTRFPLRPLVLALATCAALSACGGGGGGGPAAIGSNQLASLTGTAIDAPIASAQITITSGAPVGDAGANTIGTITANGQGGFTITVSLPSGSVPVFANAVDPANTAVTLSSYLGQSDALAAAGTLNTGNLPDLDISPVTTAALAVYAQLNGGSYSGLTPATYATNLQTYNSDILAIAAAIKAVGDNLCTPAASITSTTNLAAAIATAASLSSTSPTTLSTAISTLGGNCASVLASLPSAISADPYFGPELDLGDVIDAGAIAVPAGTYQLQGVVAQTGFGASASESNLVAPTAVDPADVFSDTAVSVSSTGTVTSTDGNVSGQLVGNLLTLTLIDPATGTKYTLRGKVGSLPTALSGGAQAYALRSGGTYTATTGGSTMLAKFDAVLAPTTATPVWNGVAAPTSPTRNDGVSCSSGFALRLDVFAAGAGGGSIGECVTPTATGWSLSAGTTGSGGDGFSFEDRNGQSSVITTAPTLSAPTWSEVSGSPFVLSAASASLSVNGTPLSGTLYYVMGTQSAVLAGASANTLLHLHGNQLTQVSEGSSYAVAAGSGGDASSGHSADH